MTNLNSVEAGMVPPHWDRWPLWALERIRLPYWWTVALTASLGIVSLVLDTAFRYRLGGVWPARDVAVGVASIVVAVYVLIDMRIVKRVSERALAELRHSVQVAEEEYEDFAYRLLHANGRVEATLLLLSALFVVVFLVLPPDQLRGLPTEGAIELAGILIIALYYMILFWLLLSLVYLSIRSARTLGKLARQPLVVNVFDPVGLLPFGRISLIQSLAFMGAFIIPLVIIGPPTRQGGGWLVIGLSLMGLLAVFVPLWGVHRQIVSAREKVLAGICSELMEVQQSLLGGAAQETETLRALSQRTDVLFQFRKQVLGSPSWPFRSSGSLVRAIIAASSPLIYFVLNRLVQIYIFPPLGLK